MTDGLYQLLAARARGKCECCGEPLGFGFAAPTVDHFLGRAKAEETEFLCWVLRADHHRAKTDNSPSAAYWIDKFLKHCSKYVGDGYRSAAYDAQEKLAWLTARKGVLP